ncbi:cytoplasmic protein [Dissulfurimicrobium hydrothermale]|nr:cytoplasmic protein [Dissulfurimicrobium hydrothermale]UKL14578.1 cytoplasmic protein [Dissulfurimicrobium hydrothermale]
MKKIVIFAFRGEAMCFVHVLLNSLDLNKKDMGGRIVIEGEATRLIPGMERPDDFLNNLYLKVKEKGLIDAVCKACSQKMGVLAEVERLGLPIASDMSGHVAMAGYIERGFEIITL